MKSIIPRSKVLFLCRRSIHSTNVLLGHETLEVASLERRPRFFSVNYYWGGQVRVQVCRNLSILEMPRDFDAETFAESFCSLSSERWCFFSHFSAAQVQFPPKLIGDLKQSFPAPSQIQAFTWPLACHGKDGRFSGQWSGWKWTRCPVGNQRAGCHWHRSYGEW